MKHAITSAILAAGLAAAAVGSAQAASSAYCSQVAQNAVDNYTHPVGSAAVGCIAGGLLGNIISHGGSAATAGGCAAGAAGGLILSNEQRKKVYNDAYWQCMNQGGPPPAPVVMHPVAGPPPSGSATVYVQLNVRSGPGTDYPRVFVIDPNTTVAVSECTSSWCHVGDNYQNGWVSRKYLFFN